MAAPVPFILTIDRGRGLGYLQKGIGQDNKHIYKMFTKTVENFVILYLPPQNEIEKI